MFRNAQNAQKQKNKKLEIKNVTFFVSFLFEMPCNVDRKKVLKVRKKKK